MQEDLVLYHPAKFDSNRQGAFRENVFCLMMIDGRTEGRTPGPTL